MSDITGKNEDDSVAAMPLTTSIEDLDFTIRTYYTLKREGISTISDIMQTPESDLEEIRDLGLKGVDEIRAKLASYGYTLFSS